eukprot:5623458-Pleurochrysis_carterae.AAC.1
MVRAFRQLTLPRSSTSLRIAASAASRSVRLPSGQRRYPPVASTLNPSAVTTSPTSTFAGA